MILTSYHLFWGNETYKTIALKISNFDTGRAKQLAGTFTYEKTKPTSLAGLLKYEVEDTLDLASILKLNYEVVNPLAGFIKGEAAERKRTIALFIKNEKQDARKTLAELLSLNYETVSAMAGTISPLCTAIKQIAGKISSEKTRQAQMAGYMKLDTPPYEFIRVGGA